MPYTTLFLLDLTNSEFMDFLRYFCLPFPSYYGILK